jgi:hypothetical protein
LNVQHAGGRRTTFAILAANLQTLGAAGEEHDDVPAGDTGGDTGGNTLEDAARGERDYVRQRLAKELGREPSEEELNEWLRRHTEGY